MDEDKQIIRNEWGIMRQYNGEVVSHPLHGPIGSREICQAAGICEEKLPEIVKAGDRTGEVSPELVKRFGMTKAPAILAGGHDQPCVALGMGAIHGGDVAYGMGTVECFTLVMDGFRQSPAMQKAHLVCAPHVVEGKYLKYKSNGRL